ncbi:hypothetical protein M2444_004698 [Paenibacillus sp. PastF-3]|uniref:hypothetical protein n=1 Tax=unclassified Paenibacillus TaxID=185978 RepID=UPI000BA08A01|nr:MULTISPECIES: hypothetical protein [unclassified Paenibacillus]MBY3621160.1 hypothetical protein [Acinetobacter sp. CUI P1]MDH6372869.1 hypothetical protein [Paenibacillus sp. PastF-3]OZQ97443.1 hypothetical protein CA598_06505 [Paenibacillus sp. VTT E-133291]
MDLIGDYKTKIEEYKRLREIAETIPTEMPYRLEIIIDLNSKIKDTEARLYKMQSFRTTIRCNQCKKYLDGDQTYRQVGPSYIICEACIQTIYQNQLSSEWERIYQLPKGCIKQDILDHKLDEYKAAGLIYRSGRYHMVSQYVVIDYYGKKRKLPDVPYPFIETIS